MGWRNVASLTSADDFLAALFQLQHFHSGINSPTHIRASAADLCNSLTLSRQALSFPYISHLIHINCCKARSNHFMEIVPLGISCSLDSLWRVQ